MSEYTGLFKSRYPTKGRRDWVRLLSPEDREVFIRMGMAAWQYGKLGGQARARSTKRDGRGRFAPADYIAPADWNNQDTWQDPQMLGHDIPF